jgi:hypothetical protein
MLSVFANTIFHFSETAGLFEIAADLRNCRMQFDT